MGKDFNKEKAKEYKMPNVKDVSIVCEPKKNWGGAWTEKKLDAFENMLRLI